MSPVCPRCSKVVYAAEQALGPGRKLYHKPCLACFQCNKRLDSYTLLEHDEQPYCKPCHLKNFGTPNLRHANLPSSPGGSPTGKQRSTSPSSIITRPITATTTGSTAGPASATTGGTAPNSFLKLKPNRSLTSPTSPTFPRSLSNPISPTTYSMNTSDFGYGNYDGNGIDDSIVEYEEPSQADDAQDPHEAAPDTAPADTDPTTNTGRPGIGTLPRTVPLARHMSSRSMDISTTTATASSSGSPPSPPASLYAFAQSRSPTSPVFSSLTGTRYGIALTGGVPSHTTGSIGVNNTGGIFPSPTGGSPRKWGSGTPSCPRCGKSVYFAEQARAVGKTFHKTCLRCVDCGTSLDSHKLRDHDGELYCVRCYQKAYGPQGNGYALLGKAGG